MFERIEWPQFGDEERSALLAALSSGKWWRNEGEFVAAFERKFADFEGAARMLALTNGTHALELALMTSEVPHGAGVVVPALTFFSSLSSIQRHRAYPVIADVDLDTWTLVSTWSEITCEVPLRAMMPVHYGGVPADMTTLQSQAKERGIFIIQDAAHGPGIEVRGQMLPRFDGLVCYSFQHSKLLPGGEGGAIAFSDESLYQRALLLHNCGRSLDSTGYEHREIASNFRMTEFVAAILIQQLARLPLLADKRRANADLFRARLNAIPGLAVQRSPSIPCRDTNYLIQVRLTAAGARVQHRDRLVKILLEKGLPINRVYPPLFELEAYWKWSEPSRTIDDLKARCPNAVLIGETGFCFHHRILLSDPGVIEKMADAIALAVSKVLETR